MIYPNKKLGQNFLKSKKYLNDIVLAAEISSKDVVLEIGPGTGNLTELLLKKAKSVIAVEKDGRMIDYLNRLFVGYKNLKLIHSDILKFKPKSHKFTVNSFSVVGNIPYYLTSHLLRTVFEKWPMPQIIVFMVQKEVAERIIVKPPHMNLLALSVQFFTEPKIIEIVPRGAFSPIPNVDSAIIKLIPKKENFKKEKTESLFKLMRVGFSSKRKILIGNLVKGLGVKKEKLHEIFLKIGLSINSRAENLTLLEWVKLAKLIEI